MSFISDLTPTNLTEEKNKFLQNQDYNPQFIYKRSFSAEELQEWGVPKQAYFEAVDQLLQQFGTEKEFTPTITTTEQLTLATQAILKQLNLSEDLHIYFSDQLISRCSITREKIVYRQPIRFNQAEFSNLMNHEIQTHLVRHLNEEKQPWRARPKSKLIDFTEEGLAGLHSFIDNQDKHMYRTWLNYAAIWLCQQFSFAVTYKKLLLYGATPEKAWFATIRAKRGITDTSQPGGNTKGLIYLEGAVHIARWMQDPEHDPRTLYIGRVTTQELSQLLPQAQLSGLIYPTFMANIGEYKEKVNQVAQANLLLSLPDVVQSS